MKNHISMLLTVIFVALTIAVNAQSATVVYNYYRAPDIVNSHAWISANTSMNGLFAYTPSVSAGPEGSYLPLSNGNPNLQKGYDEYYQWDPDYYGNPSQWRTVYSERDFESPNGLSFNSGGCYLEGGGCSYTLYPYPAQNPIATISGEAHADSLKIGGRTSAFATGNRFPPVAKATESMSIINKFTLQPGTSSKVAGETSLVNLVVRLHGTVRTPTQSHSRMVGDLGIGPSSNRLASVSGGVEIRNGGSYGTSGFKNLSYSTNTGINTVADENLGAKLAYGLDTGTLTLQFSAVVGTTYDVGLYLFLQNEINGAADLTSFSACDFSDAFYIVLESTDGTVLNWDLADTAPPVVSEFSLQPNSNNLNVGVSFTANDNSGTIASYCLTESNNSAACTWSTQKPSSYTFSSTGSKTLYAFAKDSSKNISVPVFTTVFMPYYLNVTFSGDGSGSVHSSPMTDISCMKGSSDGCGGRFGNVDVTLSASPDALTSLFDGWSGSCNSMQKDCSISMLSDANVNAAYKLAPRAKLSLNSVTGYTTLQEAYNNASSEIYSLQGLFTENWLLDMNKNITLTGGYLADYGLTRNGSTILKGTLTVQSGSLQVDALTVSSQ